ncbi:hypothetical protein HAX54_014231 [Datura stramonium]|uniref:Uncharacterized protein n=1 Tax=Datura stramonium TaxID=4076 RepID=A0ABS8TPJ3_DATST|nr:hypothetical protein [Datura stramonium]
MEFVKSVEEVKQDGYENNVEKKGQKGGLALSLQFLPRHRCSISYVTSVESMTTFKDGVPVWTGYADRSPSGALSSSYSSTAVVVPLPLWQDRCHDHTTTVARPNPVSRPTLHHTLIGSTIHVI